MKKFLFSIGLGIMMVIASQAVISDPVLAQSTGEFSIQVTPSPLVTTIKPGQTTEIELKVRSNSLEVQNLTMSPRSFHINNETGEVQVDDTSPPEIKDWISFSSPDFTVQPGQWFTQKVKISLPKDTGFSYSFALIISPKTVQQKTESGRLLKGSVAVFTLVNVDRPGAVRKLDVVELETTKQLYEYIPADIKVRFKNSGNSIVQPYGNIFIQRGSEGTNPIAALAVNDNKGYILPGTSRTLTTKWDNGFPSFKTNTDGTTGEVWDWSKIADLRIGQYTAKLVGVYNDGERDVPLEAAVTFWVIPWRAILALITFIVIVWFIGRKIAQRRTQKAVRIALAAQSAIPKYEKQTVKGGTR